VREVHPGVIVKAGYDDAPIDFDSPTIWDLHMAVIESLLDAPVDAVFTSDDYGAEMARRLSARWVQVDPGRRLNPISGTAVRAHPDAHWSALAPCVRAWYVRRIVITGAESTGTTTLARALSEHFACPHVLEYGREWSATRPGGLAAPWRTEEFVEIAATQNAHEAAAARVSPNRWIVCDTDALATAVWHERYMGFASPDVLAIAARQRRPLVRILTGDEISFVQDGLRDGEHIRHAMQERFREILSAPEAGGVPWVELRGSVEARLAQALAFIDSKLAATLP
jgi:NadR type nicotinamide-nucleotide adenylyltransferase